MLWVKLEEAWARIFGLRRPTKVIILVEKLAEMIILIPKPAEVRIIT